MDYIEKDSLDEDSLLDDAITLCKEIRKKKKLISDLEEKRIELRGKFPEDSHAELESEIIRLYEELGDIVDGTTLLKIERAEVKQDLDRINNELFRYEYADHPPFDESYFMRRTLKLKYTIKGEVIDKKLDAIKEKSKPYREQIQGNLIALIGEITDIFPDFSKNELFMITPKLYINPKRKAFELTSQDYKVNGSGIVRSIINSAFKQIDGMNLFLEGSLKQDYVAFYEIISKIAGIYENGYAITADLMRFSSGNVPIDNITIKVKKIGSKKYGEFYE